MCGMKRVMAVLMSATLVLTGCTENMSAAGSGQETVKNTQEYDTVQQSLFGREESTGALLVSQGIELPVSTTRVFVNQSGYISDREKKVMFLGERLGDSFRVIRQSDKAVVYTGHVEQGRTDEISGLYLSMGDFTGLTKPGTYYIETDVIGQSYPFQITSDGYERLFIGLLKNADEVPVIQDADGVCNTAFGMHAIMHAMQCNGSIFEEAYKNFEEDEQDRQLVTQLLHCASRLMAQQNENGSLYDDYEATAAFCGILVMSRDVFGRYEESVAKAYRDAADKAWSWLEKQECDTQDRKNARFYASSQLFKAEYTNEYKKMTEDFLREADKDYSSERFVFYGVLAYISAGNNTDRDLCTHIMKDLVDKNEQACQKAKKDVFFGTGNRTMYDSLYNMMLLCFINYITPSKEYTEIIENTIQYMGGLNEKGVCYIDGSGVWREISETCERNLEWNGILIFAMSDMLKNLIDIENNW